MSTKGHTEKNDNQIERKAVLEVNNLVKEFGGLTAVDHLSFKLYEQEIVGFIGPNGAGKSTTFNCIMGSYEPTSGTVHFKGKDVTNLKVHEVVKRGMSRTYQHFAQLKDRSVADNVRLALTTDDIIPNTDLPDQMLAEEICRRVGLEDKLDDLPSELSHAGLLRLELARGIATKPDVMLIDEPFAGLSSKEVQELSDVIRELRNHGMTLIIVDHNMDGLLELIDRGIVIQFGEKIAQGEPEEIVEDETVKKAYLGE